MIKYRHHSYLGKEKGGVGGSQIGEESGVAGGKPCDTME